MNKVRVDLPDRDQWPRAPLPDGPQLAEKGGPILFHCPLRILTGEAEIQASPTIDSGKTAWPGAEAMDQPGNGRQRIRLQNFAWCLPESFRGHRNILAIVRPLPCNKCQV